MIRYCFAFIFFFSLFGCSDDEVDPTFVESEFWLDQNLYSIETNLYWQKVSEAGQEDQIRLLQEVSQDGETDMIIVIPVVGSGELEGSYIYSKTRDVRTYDLVYVRNIDEKDNFEWITNGNSGSTLTIVRAGYENGKPIYTVIIEDFELNYGFYDFLGDKWVSLGVKQFNFQYQGIIESP